MARIRLTLAALGPWALGLGLLAQSAGSLESTFFDGRAHPAIAYDVRPSDDLVARLDRALDAGQVRLEFEPDSGYLRSLLRMLDVNTDTQLAVFSKTSLQSPIITPRNPRAIFFNDSVAVAWPRGGFIEIAAQDPSQGFAFYMLDQRQSVVPRFRRERTCLTCHVAYATLNVPGPLVRSVAAAPGGEALPFLANSTVDHRTPYDERWAGWFVTGSTPGLRHLGNVTIANPQLASAVATPAVSQLETLKGRFDPAGYLSPRSDIAAMLVFGHQMHMMNLITRIGWQTRIALADERPGRTDAAAINAATAEFVDYLLFVDEPRLPAPVKGASGFAERFSALGPRDRRGRSLRELDLQTRVLKYPCSYLVYSPAFDALPRESKAAIYTRLNEVLTGKASGARYQRLAAADRQAILEILRDTKPDFAAFVAKGP